MDFLSDALVDGRALRAFAAVDDFSRRYVAMEFDVALPADRVTRFLDEAMATFGGPKRIRTDNGPEFTSKAFDAWCYAHGIDHHFIRPGKLVENAFAESLNGRIRDEFFNQHCFRSVRHARDLGSDWHDDYNELRPHTALGGRSPGQFLADLCGPLGDHVAPRDPNSTSQAIQSKRRKRPTLLGHRPRPRMSACRSTHAVRRPSTSICSHHIH